MDKKKIIIIIAFILLVFFLIGFIYSNKEVKVKEKDNNIDEVSFIDDKLGSDINISQSYLMNYVVKKSGIWYKSEGYIKDIKVKDNKTIYSISNGDNIVKAYIDSNKELLKKDSYVYLVYTIDLDSGSLKIVKISDKDINYNSAIKVGLDDIYNNINSLLDNKFIINGYMVTLKDKYILYNSKEEYQNENKDYFVINWDGDPIYTGNANVKLECKVKNTYSLKDCNVIEQ